MKGSQWSGKNDGTPGCLRTRRPIRHAIYFTRGECLCGGIEVRHLPPDANWPAGRPVCQRCHQWERA